MNYREQLNNIPGSYDDFVNSVVRWSEKDNDIKNTITQHLKSNPDTTTSEVLGIIWDKAGIGEPLPFEDEISNDEKLRSVV